MTAQNELDTMIKQQLEKDGRYLLAEEVRSLYFPSLTMHQIRQALGRLCTEGVLISKTGDDGAFKRYGYNMMHGGSRLINSIWRRK